MKKEKNPRSNKLFNVISLMESSDQPSESSENLSSVQWTLSSSHFAGFTSSELNEEAHNKKTDDSSEQNC